MSNKFRVGVAYDAHPLRAGRKLVLGGVAIPFERGLAGWSDGDTLTHAVVDALLGAAALGDIGSHFPPGDPRFKDISSLELLRRVREELAAHGWRMVNVDVTVVAIRPMLRDYIPPMRRALARTLDTAEENLNIKASTANGLGFAGAGAGIAAHAVAMIEGT